MSKNKFSSILSLFDGMSCGQIALKLLGNGWTVDVISHIFKSLLK